MVADDINAIVASFDPRVYFPKLFLRFSLLYATNITELAACEENRETPEWRALQELYKVDIDSFVEFQEGVE